MRFLEISIETTDAFSDIISDMLIEEGSEGVVIESAAAVREHIINHLDYDCADNNGRLMSLLEQAHYYDTAITDNLSDVTVVKGYYANLEIMPEIERRIAAFKQAPEIDCGTLIVSAKTVNDEDWKDVWKKYYVPIDFGGIVVVPEWIDYKTDKLKLLISPGAAFGTGKHETTGMCLRELCATELKGKKVADIGCGSGILGIAAALTGADTVYMTDIDDSATAQTVKNAELNSVTDKITVACGDLMSGKRDGYDVIIANIVSDVLIRMAGDIKYFCNGQTKLILSGIINERADEVSGAYLRQDFYEYKRVCEGEWTMLVMMVKPL